MQISQKLSKMSKTLDNLKNMNAGVFPVQPPPFRGYQVLL